MLRYLLMAALFARRVRLFIALSSTLTFSTFPKLSL
jgi:hypothetical protein